MESEIPVVEEYEIFQILDKAKEENSSVPGDMPPKLLYQASTGLAKPAAQIMNNIANFILYNQVLSEPQATIANFIDYKQGFNRCQHSICIEILAQKYNVPGWLLKILVGYLSGRTMKVRFKGHVGKENDIQCGAGQGAPLGM